MSVVVGIDLGVTGALSAIDHRGEAVIHDLPILQDDSGKRLDAPSFIRLLRTLIPVSEAGCVVTENVTVRRIAQRNAPVNFAGESTLVGLRYAVHAACDIARIRLHFVAPQSWKAHYGITSDKSGQVAREIAASLYPCRAKDLGRVKDHNRAESLLIAHYGKAKLA